LHSEAPWVLETRKFPQIQVLPLRFKESALLAVNREQGTSRACFIGGSEADISEADIRTERNPQIIVGNSSVAH
jgi:hypothetical protein